MSNVGDLGRRVRERRDELGLSSDAVAARAGMDPGYLRELEASPSPQPSRATLWRLAGALETTVGDITGGGTQMPPGEADPLARPALDVLDDDDCRSLIDPGGVGRVVFSQPRGPVALPVNYRMLDGDIVFRTAQDSTLRSSPEQHEVSFEIDRLDEALTEGWSVLVSGKAHVITDPAEHERAQALDIAPWAGGDRHVYVRIATAEMTGRRIRHS